MATVTLTKDVVTLYDIQTNTVWDTMSARAAHSHLQASDRLGDTLQAYDTHDRDGNPIRVVLEINAPSHYSEPDQGGVYVIPLPAAN